MDGDAIFVGCPTETAWLALDQEAKRGWVLTVIGKALQDLDDRGREPDAWESSDLGGALGYCICGWYSASFNLVRRATTPMDKRAPGKSDGTPPLTLNALRLGYLAVSNLPVVNGG